MKAKTVFFCTECGSESVKWAGQCSVCGSWNTLVEQPSYTKPKSKSAGNQTLSSSGFAAVGLKYPQELSKLNILAELRFKTGLTEFDRVLGGGAVVGSLVLVGGAPGIGKSTLLMQVCGLIDRSLRILYVSGEESESQIKMRADRLGVKGDGVFILAQTDLEEVIHAVNELRPDVLIIDSIQTLYNSELTGSPGSVGQVKDCAAALLRLSKDIGITVFLVGHVNKEGAIAGPKVLEHMVDCVLYFEGERALNYRILRAAKNRFGSTNELSVFEMRNTGLCEVSNPSEMLIEGRPVKTPGTCVTCVVEGTRPILAEIQALVTPTSAAMPRRNSNGIEYNRAMMLIAVLTQHCGLRLGSSDAFINVIGGLNIDDTGADLAVALALASSYKNKAVRDDMATFGEIGLTGELRQVSGVEFRLNEIKRLGFKACILHQSAKRHIKVTDDLELIYAKTVNQAIESALM